VVRNDRADSPLFQADDHFLQVKDGQRVDPGKGLVEKQEGRLQGESPANFEFPPFSSAQAVSRLIGESQKAELCQEFARQALLFFVVVGKELENQPEVVLDRGLEEDRAFLGKISETELRTFGRGAPGNIHIPEKNPALVRLDQTDDHLEGRRLAGSVPAEKADDLSRADREIDALDDEPPPVAFGQVFRPEHGH